MVRETTAERLAKWEAAVPTKINAWVTSSNPILGNTSSMLTIWVPMVDGVDIAEPPYGYSTHSACTTRKGCRAMITRKVTILQELVTGETPDA